MAHNPEEPSEHRHLRGSSSRRTEALRSFIAGLLESKRENKLDQSAIDAFLAIVTAQMYLERPTVETVNACVDKEIKHYSIQQREDTRSRVTDFWRQRVEATQGVPGEEQHYKLAQRVLTEMENGDKSTQPNPSNNGNRNNSPRRTETPLFTRTPIPQKML